MKKTNQNQTAVFNVNRIFATAMLVFALSLGHIASANNDTRVETKTTVSGSHTPLCVAISKGDAETVKKFIEYGVDVNEISNDYTPLMIAARYNRADIVAMLLKAGADTKVRNTRGMTALKVAEQFNAEDAAQVLRQS